ncbi:MAG: glycosyltransferase [Planctomycetota bacterium]
MKIAYITSLYPAVSQTFILREIQALRAQGFDIQTFSVRKAGKMDSLGLETTREAENTRSLLPLPIADFFRAVIWVIVTRPLTGITTLWSAWRGRALTLSDRIKGLAYFVEAILLAFWLVRGGIVHLHCHFGNSGSSPAALAARLAHIPFSITCHGSELREIKKNRLPEKVEQASFVICISHFGKAQLMLTCPPNHWPKLYVIHCGLEDDELDPAAEHKSAAGNTPFKLLCVGRLSPEKGHLILLDALDILHRRGVAVHCTLVGDGPMKTQIEHRAADLDIANQLTLTGAMEHTQVKLLYRSCDAVVLASFSEGIPVVLMEALAEGKPVVATSVGGIPELIIHGETGLLVPPGHINSLADAIQRLADNPSWAQSLAEKGRQHVRDQFRNADSARQLAVLFRNSPRVTVE